MEHIFVSNGHTQLIIVPDTDADRILLEKLVGEGPLEVELIRSPIGVLGQNLKDAMIIRKKQTSLIDDNSKS